MLEQMTARLGFHGEALMLRSQRQQLIASNIANADTPGYVARDIDFGAALRDATGVRSGSDRPLAAPQQTHGAHLKLGSNNPRNPELAYTLQTQPSQDGNTVDLDRERASFVDNSVRYEATLRFINSNVKTMLSAITGQSS